MRTSAFNVAVWAQSCSFQLSAGVGLGDVLEGVDGLPRRRALKTVKSLRKGLGIGESFIPLIPHLSCSDIALIHGAERAGRLPEGFRLLADQYFLRAQLTSTLLAAFIRPLFVFLVGLLIIDVQRFLYGQATPAQAGIDCILRLFPAIVGIYLLKKILLMRPLLLNGLIARLPFFRAISQCMAVERFTWALLKLNQTAVPIHAAAIAAADASGRSKVISLAEHFRKRITLGESFATAFPKLLSGWPKWVRLSSNVPSPADIDRWAGATLTNSKKLTERAQYEITRFAKPVAIILILPLVLWTIKVQYSAMVAQYGRSLP